MKELLKVCGVVCQQHLYSLTSNTCHITFENYKEGEEEIKEKIDDCSKFCYGQKLIKINEVDLPSNHCTKGKFIVVSALCPIV